MNPFASVTLLASDGSIEARRAARLAVELSQSLGSELHAVCVEPLPSPYAFPESKIIDPDFRHEMRERAQQEASVKLEEEVGRIRELGGEVSGSHAAAGRPDAEIVRGTEEVRADLVILGSRGLGPIKRAAMGSVSDSVVRHAHGSVLVVRGNGGEDIPRGSLVLAIDGSEGAKLATRAAAEISAAGGSEVHVIYVLPTTERLYGVHRYSDEVKESLLEQARNEARKFLDAQAERVESDGGTIGQTYLGTACTAPLVDAGWYQTGWCATAQGQPTTTIAAPLASNADRRPVPTRDTTALTSWSPWYGSLFAIC